MWITTTGVATKISQGHGLPTKSTRQSEFYSVFSTLPLSWHSTIDSVSLAQGQTQQHPPLRPSALVLSFTRRHIYSHHLSAPTSQTSAQSSLHPHRSPTPPTRLSSSLMPNHYSTSQPTQNSKCTKLLFQRLRRLMDRPDTKTISFLLDYCSP